MAARTPPRENAPPPEAVENAQPQEAIQPLNLQELIAQGLVTNKLNIDPTKLQATTLTKEKMEQLKEMAEQRGKALCDVAIILTFSFASTSENVESLSSHLVTNDAQVIQAWSVLGAEACQDIAQNAMDAMSLIKRDKIRAFLRPFFSSTPLTPIVNAPNATSTSSPSKDAIVLHIKKRKAEQALSGNIDMTTAKEMLEVIELSARGFPCKEWLVPHPECISYLFSCNAKCAWLNNDNSGLSISPARLKSRGGLSSSSQNWWGINDFTAYLDALSTFITGLHVINVLEKPEEVLNALEKQLFSLRKDIICALDVKDWDRMISRILVRAFSAYSLTGGSLDDLLTQVKFIKKEKSK
jgi:hypothetical protein